MKKAIQLLLLAMAMMGVAKSFAQTGKGFEGKITCTIDIQGLPPEAAGMFAGSEMTLYIKGANSRSEMSMGMVSKTTSIVDQKTKTTVVLMDMMGQKYMIKSNPEDVKKAEASPAPEIKYLNDTKVIAGYNCKKAQIIMKDEKGAAHTIDIYYTDALPYYSQGDIYKGLKGFPMEYEMKQGQMTMKVTTTTISKEVVADSQFVIPEGYKETTAEQIQKSMMQGQ